MKENRKIKRRCFILILGAAGVNATQLLNRKHKHYIDVHELKQVKEATLQVSHFLFVYGCLLVWLC